MNSLPGVTLDTDRVMDWISAFKTLEPVLGPLAAVLLVLLVWEKYDHAQTRKELTVSYKERVEETMLMTRVIEASAASTNARSDTTREQTVAFNQLTTVSNMLLNQFNSALSNMLNRR